MKKLLLVIGVVAILIFVWVFIGCNKTETVRTCGREGRFNSHYERKRYAMAESSDHLE